VQATIDDGSGYQHYTSPSLVRPTFHGFPLLLLFYYYFHFTFSFPLLPFHRKPLSQQHISIQSRLCPRMTRQTFRNNIKSLLHSVCQPCCPHSLFSLFYNLQYLWGETIPSIRFKFVACHIRTVCIVEDDVPFKHKLRFILQTALRSPKESNENVTNLGNN
jgi:hypothetical protein